MRSQLIQQLDKYTREQHSTWEFLYERQASHLRGKAIIIYLNTLDEMSDSLTSDKIHVVKSMATTLSGEREGRARVAYFYPDMVR